MITVLALWSRDHAVCHICGKFVPYPYTSKFGDPDRASRDHVVPKSLGGTNRATNIKLAHASCNASKANGMPLIIYG
jgi:5-methylcytosine-specific restriction endonuclease McrA